MADVPHPEDLSAELAAARVQLSAHGVGLRRSLNVPDMIRRQVRLHPAALFGAAAVVGLGLAQLVPRHRDKSPVSYAPAPAPRPFAPPPAKKTGGMLSSAFHLAMDFAAPSLIRWLADAIAPPPLDSPPPPQAKETQASGTTP